MLVMPAVPLWVSAVTVGTANPHWVKCILEKPFRKPARVRSQGLLSSSPISLAAPYEVTPACSQGPCSVKITPYCTLVSYLGQGAPLLTGARGTPGAPGPAAGKSLSCHSPSFWLPSRGLLGLWGRPALPRTLAVRPCKVFPLSLPISKMSPIKNTTGANA